MALGRDGGLEWSGREIGKGFGIWMPSVLTGPIQTLG
jgi:hypothetical protein